MAQVLIQGGSVAFEELNDSPKFTVGRDSREASRHGKIAWTDIQSAINELFPAAPALPGIYPGVSYLYAESAEIEPWHPEAIPTDGTIATYATPARIRIKYSTKLYDPSDLIVRKYGFSGEFLTLTGAGLYWESGPQVEQEDVSAAKIVPMVEHSLTRHRATFIPWTAIQANIGRVNKNTINNSYFTNIPRECLLYMGAEVNFTLSTNGTTVWTLEHRFQERRVDLYEDTSSTGGATGIGGWNHFYRQTGASPGFDRIFTADGDPIYSYSQNDFAGLFV